MCYFDNMVKCLHCAGRMAKSVHPDQSALLSTNTAYPGLLLQIYWTKGTVASLTLVLLNPDIPCLSKQCRSRSVGFANSVDPDQKKPTDLDLHCLPLSM